jgi:hypothetical protein
MTNIGGVPVNDVRARYPFAPGRAYAVRGLNAITHHVQHHTVTATPTTEVGALAVLDAIYAYHTGTHGWPGTGYHFAIDGLGTIYYINGIELESYHAKQANAFGVGVAWLGTFSFAKDPPPPEMVEAAAQLYRGLEIELGRPLVLAGHREVNNDTLCPGDHWPQTKLRMLDRLQPSEVRLYADWTLASLANDGQEVRGPVGRTRFRDHLTAMGLDGGDPPRYGWPIWARGLVGGPSGVLVKNEVRLYADWALASLANDLKEIRGPVGRQRFATHLTKLGLAPADTWRYGWPGA